MSRWARTKIAIVAALVTVGTVAGTSQAATGTPFTVPDFCSGQCNDILPPGENGNATLADILANKLLGTAPAHTNDQLNTYGNLAGNYQNLTNATIDSYFNDSSFGVPASQVASSIQPRSDVTIVRDKATGVPHIVGTTRSGTEFGAGYAAAQDRLWLMDLFRHVGRGELSSFAGGAAANRALEQTFWAAAPYTEQDLQNQVNTIAASGSAGAQAMQDINSYVSGINLYITQAFNARTFPGEYDLTGHINPVTNAGSIQPFGPTDLIAIASVVGHRDRGHHARHDRRGAGQHRPRSCSPHRERRPEPERGQGDLQQRRAARQSAVQQARHVERPGRRRQVHR